LLRRDPSRIILPVLAAHLADERALWLFMQDFKRIEAPGVQPFPVEEAAQRTLRALALDPAYALAMFNRGAVLHDLKRDGEALDAFNRALALGFDGIAAWNAKAIVLRALGREAEAREAEARAKALGG
jgi:tetratricopeptide (TPR) repeat protein